MAKRPCILAVFVLAATVSTALADRIDGVWCSPEGQSMTIDGDRATLSSGRMVTGRYTRHHFDYAIPAGEADAGSRLSADQIDDEHIGVVVLGQDRAASGDRQIWSRCQVTS